MGSLHGFEIDCDRELRRLSPAPGSLGTVRVRATSDSPLAESCELLHLIAPDWTPTHAIGRSHSRLVSWHADGGSFRIDATTGRIAYRSEDATAAAGSPRWEDRLGSTAVTILAGERGGLPLHASAVGVDGRAVLLCGVTGRGKSTLAAALAARGHEAIAEDGVVVQFNDGVPLVWPGLGGALITPEVATAIGIAAPGPGHTDARGRLLVEAPRGVTAPAPAAGVAILMARGGDRVKLVRPQPEKAHRELLAHVVGARRGAAAFASAARLVERVPVTLLVVPDSVESVPEAAEALESLPGPA